MTDKRAESIAQLEAGIAALERSIAAVAHIPQAAELLRRQLTDQQQALAGLRQAFGAPADTQAIGSDAQDGRADDVHGSIRQHSGGPAPTPPTNHGPQILGPVSASRDINIATNQLLINAGADAPATPTRIPELRLWLEGPDGAPLSRLTVGAQALLRLAPAPGAAAPTLALQLEADGPGVEWPEGTRRALQLHGAAGWALIPTQTGRLNLRVLVLAGGALVQQLGLTTDCRPAGTLLSGPADTPAAPAQAATIGLALSAVPSLPDRAHALTLVIDREREGLTLRLIDGGSVTTCRLALTDAELADLLALARSELLAIVHAHDGQTYLFQEPELSIPAAVAEAALAQLARLGAALWQALFAGPGGSGDALALGERLRARSQATPLHLTIAAARMPFPWPLLYDRSLSQPITPDGFWGFRHVLASMPTSGRAGPLIGDLSLGPAEGLRALVGLNLRIDAQVGDGMPPVIPGQRQAFAELGIAADELTSEAGLRDALAAGSDAALVYLYCHVLSVAPGGAPVRPGEGDLPGVTSTRIVLTRAENGLSLQDLQLAAPLGAAARLRGGPLVILNACGSAELSPLTYAGLAPYLLDLGARAVIGTECETPVYFGAAFGAALLRAVVADRLSVGEALRATRRAFFEQQHNPLGLLYALYGSADLRVAKPPGPAAPA